MRSSDVSDAPKSRSGPLIAGPGFPAGSISYSGEAIKAAMSAPLLGCSTRTPRHRPRAKNVAGYGRALPRTSSNATIRTGPRRRTGRICGSICYDLFGRADWSLPVTGRPGGARRRSATVPSGLGSVGGGLGVQCRDEFAQVPDGSRGLDFIPAGGDCPRRPVSRTAKDVSRHGTANTGRSPILVKNAAQAEEIGALVDFARPERARGPCTWGYRRSCRSGSSGHRPRREPARSRLIVARGSGSFSRSTLAGLMSR